MIQKLTASKLVDTEKIFSINSVWLLPWFGLYGGVSSYGLGRHLRLSNDWPILMIGRYVASLHTINFPTVHVPEISLLNLPVAACMVVQDFQRSDACFCVFFYVF